MENFKKKNFKTLITMSNGDEIKSNVTLKDILDFEKKEESVYVSIHQHYVVNKAKSDFDCPNYKDKFSEVTINLFQISSIEEIK